MTFLELQLADTPVLGWQCQLVGAAVNGDVMPDASSSGMEGEVLHSHGPEPYGKFSPVETDPLSKAFGAHGDGTVFPIEYSRIRKLTDDLIEPTADFFLKAFIRPTGGSSFSPQPLVGKGSGNVIGDGAGQTCFIGMDIFSARFVGRMLDNAGNTYDVVDTLVGGTAGDLINGDWHYVVIWRAGNSFNIAVDGRLGATTTITSGLPTRVVSGDFYVLPSQTSPIDCEFTEVWFGTHSTTLSQVLAEYEASKLINDMYVVMSGRSSFQVNSDPPPTYPFFPYSHDFTNPLTERLSRVTQVELGKDGSEERTARSSRTRRKLTTDVIILDARARRQFASFLRNNQRKPVAWPISVHESDLTAPITAGDTQIFVDTVRKDFDIGCRAAVFSSEFDFEVFEIIDMDDTSITVLTAAVSDWPVEGTTCVPVKRAYLEQSLDTAGHTTDSLSTTITASVLVEDIVESPNHITPYTPALTYRDIEVLDVNGWGLSDYSEDQSGDSVQTSDTLDQQTGLFRIDSDVDFSTPGIPYSLFLDDEELISKFLGWYEARAGRLSNLWVPTLIEDFNVVSVGTVAVNKLVVTESDYIDSYGLDESRRHICLVQTDGSIIFRRVESAAVDGDNEVLTLDTSVSAYAETTEYVCFLLLCRLNADDIDLQWTTTDLVHVNILFRETPKDI